MLVTVENDIDVIDYDKYREVDPIPVNLPHLYTAREYQQPVWNAALSQLDRVNRFLLLWHRRAGKDKTFWNIFVAKTQERPGLYLYMLPTTSQAKKVIWKGQDKEGIKFLDHIPQELIVSKHESDMSIELKNGSIIMVLGSDNYDRIVGTNPLGVAFSEYSIADPLAWDYIRPILAENGGWAMFCYTSRGKNHGYKLYKTNKNNKKWYVSRLDVTQTFDADGNRAISEDAIQDEIDAGMDEATVKQEFYLSFDAIGQGVIYKDELLRMKKENRICRVPIDTKIPVNTLLYPNLYQVRQ